MTNESFLKLMKPLVDFFGEKQYAGRMHLIFDKVKDLPDYSLKKIVNHFLETRSVYEAPLPTHFVEEANRQRALLNNGGAGPKSDIHDLAPPGDALQKILEKSNVRSLTELIKRKNQGA